MKPSLPITPLPVTKPYALSLQTVAFEPEAAEAAPYKAAVAVAAELAGTLEGTQRANPKKGGAGSLQELNAVPQVIP